MAVVQFASTFIENAQVSVRATTSFTLDKNMNQVFAQGGAISCTLPEDPPDGKVVQFIATGGAITLVANTGQTLGGGAASDVLPQFGVAFAVWDGQAATWCVSKVPA